MARQRFIWPTIWDDPDLGRLSSDARLLYIGCFSLADDDGRILGDPVFLRTQIFRYRTMSDARVTSLRDEVAGACKSFLVYTKDGADYIAFANWNEFQKPKYPRPSKLPPPPGKRKSARLSQKASGNGSGSLPEGSSAIPPRDGLGFYPPTPREKGTNPRAKASSPRQRGQSPRQTGSSPRDHDTNPRATKPHPNECPHCGARQRSKPELEDHIRYVHYDQQTDATAAVLDDDIPF